MDAFFFPTTDSLQLFGVARGPKNAKLAWVLCPPFAEEEKSSRRFFTHIAKRLEARNEASLLFSFRGTGDSSGDFGAADLTVWRRDLHATKNELQRRAPGAQIAFLGVRLGASLALQEAEKLGARRLILIEPLLSGRSFLMQQSARKQIRAQLTGEVEVAKIANSIADSTDDLDGWPLGAAMKSELNALDLRREPPLFSGQISVLQVGPREEVALPLQEFARGLGARTRAVVMPPFWNLIDAPDPAPLLQTLEEEFNVPFS
ncbi:Serine aminopeptidase, S33 [Abditibacterium utsteinense]|uniref:Serine aminopeptidase, S33 n=1 Tax=Abditibacterium utsteinense TaxID=1960156 RepID=A0A2S8SW09_9BACT|nr:alpha/beta hydrolase [Abditibacterium utsteinense]PQV64980.1 Serine aminopeptidase, S33 [Abditibacterium utsteinense]